MDCALNAVRRKLLLSTITWWGWVCSTRWGYAAAWWTGNGNGNGNGNVAHACDEANASHNNLRVCSHHHIAYKAFSKLPCLLQPCFSQ